MLDSVDQLWEYPISTNKHLIDFTECIWMYNVSKCQKCHSRYYSIYTIYIYVCIELELNWSSDGYLGEHELENMYKWEQVEWKCSVCDSRPGLTWEQGIFTIQTTWHWVSQHKWMSDISLLIGDNCPNNINIYNNHLCKCIQRYRCFLMISIFRIMVFMSKTWPQ